MKIKHYKSFNIIYLTLYKELQESYLSEIKSGLELGKSIMRVGMRKVVNDKNLNLCLKKLNRFERELLYSSIIHDAEIQSAK